MGLDLDDNQILEIPDGAFTGLNKLQQLWLWRNQIFYISVQAFAGLNNLQELDLDENQMSQIQDSVFAGLSSLQELLLKNNQISEIPDGVFRELYSLQKLYLGGNHLSTLDSTILESIPRPLALDLYYNSSDNLWDCETMCWLKKEEEDGTVVFIASGLWNHGSTPKCKTGDWSLLDCSGQGELLLCLFVCVRHTHERTYCLKVRVEFSFAFLVLLSTKKLFQMRSKHFATRN